MEKHSRKNILIVLNLSQLGFIVFPFLGLIIPFAIWNSFKNESKSVDSIGKSIINYQITWLLALFVFFLLPALSMIFRFELISFHFNTILYIYGGMYLYSISLIVINTIIVSRICKVSYFPSIRFLN